MQWITVVLLYSTFLHFCTSATIKNFEMVTQTDPTLLTSEQLQGSQFVNPLESGYPISANLVQIQTNTETDVESETATDSTITPITTIPPDDECPSSPDPDKLTQDQFSSELTDGCKYDRLVKPKTNGPMPVRMLIDIRHIEAVDQLQFKMHMLVQLKYLDWRLDYRDISPKRGDMLGEVKLRDKIWIPHIVIHNERDTSIMGLEGKDIFVRISPEGNVLYSYRMTATIYCWMDLKKFPFDEQLCYVNFTSWTYNASDIVLTWETGQPLFVADQLHLTEFRLTNYWASSGTVNTTFERGGTFVGKFSNLAFNFQLSREIGFYIMDYFIPSILLVCTSWITFWLQADNTAPRVTLGTSTMLSFITLASGQSKSLPKVSYIKANEIWFLGCTMFIFASMAEFAFVNIIWRRKKQIELEKVNSKNILKWTLTPKLARRDLQRSLSVNNLHKSHSCSSLYGNINRSTLENNYLTVNSYHSMTVPTITMQSDDDLIKCNSRRQSDEVTVGMRSTVSEDEPTSKWTTMSHQEIAQWIDKRSRLVFPTAFLIFNIFYWSFVYIL